MSSHILYTAVVVLLLSFVTGLTYTYIILNRFPPSNLRTVLFLVFNLIAAGGGAKGRTGD